MESNAENTHLSMNQESSRLADMYVNMTNRALGEERLFLDP